MEIKEMLIKKYEEVLTDYDFAVDLYAQDENNEYYRMQYLKELGRKYLLEEILDEISNKKDVEDIPQFEGTLEQLDDLCNIETKGE